MIDTKALIRYAGNGSDKIYFDFVISAFKSEKKTERQKKESNNKKVKNDYSPKQMFMFSADRYDCDLLLMFFFFFIFV